MQGGERVEAETEDRHLHDPRGRQKGIGELELWMQRKEGHRRTSLALAESGVRSHRLPFHWPILSCSGLRAAENAGPCMWLDRLLPPGCPSAPAPCFLHRLGSVPVLAVVA